MTSQPARNHSSPERPIRRDVAPPAPGQAYFGYPQPSRVPFPVPQQGPAEAGSEADRPTQPTPPVSMPVLRAPNPAAQPEPALWPVPGAAAGGRRPNTRRRTGPRSGIWVHLIGYSLAVVFGLEIGIAVMRLR